MIQGLIEMVTLNIRSGDSSCRESPTFNERDELAAPTSVNLSILWPKERDGHMSCISLCTTRLILNTTLPTAHIQYTHSYVLPSHRIVAVLFLLPSSCHYYPTLLLPPIILLLLLPMSNNRTSPETLVVCTVSQLKKNKQGREKA